MFLQDATTKEFYVPLSIFVFTGIGFILANKYGNKKEVGEEIN
jgi:positive regulator of sigma E activity